MNDGYNMSSSFDMFQTDDHDCCCDNDDDDDVDYSIVDYIHIDYYYNDSYDYIRRRGRCSTESFR